MPARYHKYIEVGIVRALFGHCSGIVRALAGHWQGIGRALSGHWQGIEEFQATFNWAFMPSIEGGLKGTHCSVSRSLS